MSTRLTILQALIKNGQSTYDDLELSTGISRDKLRIAINDAKKAQHVILKKDDTTGQPAYSVTKDGRAWVKKNGTPAADAAQEAREAEQELTKAEQKPANAPIPTALTVAPRDESAAKVFQARISELQASLSAWTSIAERCGVTSPDEMLNAFAAQDIRLTDQVRKTNEALHRAGELEEQLQAAHLSLMSTAPVAATVGTLEPAGYLVTRPKKPLRRFTALHSAQAVALSAVRGGSSAEVFALHPVGKAIRGAEWKGR